MTPGTQLGHYEILSAIGKGGMGEVWKARDTKLDREVAIKTLPPEFAQDADRLARFEREAKLLASLNHPNIAAIYGLEEHEGSRFLVLELVEGDTLADRLKRGAIPVEESLKLALQIAEALEAAHEKGVIHRDLKPANIKVTPDGKVKVLDFGLAKAFAGEQADANLSNSPTLSMQATEAGIILGTAAYMSPEQASGKETDKRGDIWSFGVVVYEMLTGQSAFAGETVSHVLASVLKTEPDWMSLPPDTPFLLKHLLQRCIAKDRNDRLRDIADARLELQHIEDVDTEPAGRVAAVSSRWRLVAPILGIGAMAGALIAFGVLSEPNTSNEPVLRKFLLPLESPIGYFDTSAVSPDGSRVAFTRNGVLHIQPLDRLEAIEIGGSFAASFPFWSPDGESVGYHEAGILKTVSAEGGPSISLVAISGGFGGASWGADDTIVFTENGVGLRAISTQTGEVRPSVGLGPEDTWIGRPVFLPDGQSFLFNIRHVDGSSYIAVQAGDEQTLLLPGVAEFLGYSSTGHIVYQQDFVDGGIWALRFDPSTSTISGQPFPIAEDGFDPSVSSDGTLLYRKYSPIERVVFVDRAGEVTSPIGEEHAVIWKPEVSPDGTLIASQVNSVGINDIYFHDVASNRSVRRTRGVASEAGSSWSPAGDRIAIETTRNGSGDIFIKNLNDDTEEPFATGPAQQEVPSWSPQGDFIAFQVLEPDREDRDIWYKNLSMDSESQLFFESEFEETLPQFSPDGNYLAYQSNVEGQWEIFIREFPSAGGERKVSVDGGIHPRWSPVGDEIFYVHDMNLMAVAVQTEPTLELGTPQLLFDTRASGVAPKLNWSLNYFTYDVYNDGERFVFVQQVPQAGEQESNIVVVQNWYEEFLDEE